MSTVATITCSTKTEAVKLAFERGIEKPVDVSNWVSENTNQVVKPNYVSALKAKSKESARKNGTLKPAASRKSVIQVPSESKGSIKECFAFEKAVANALRDRGLDATIREVERISAIIEQIS